MFFVLPGLTVFLATLVAILPFGAGDTVRACLSFLPIIVTHYWAVRRPHLVPVSLIFVFGVSIDILTHGPVGYWALLMLSAAAFARLEHAVTGQSTTAGRAAMFCITILCVAALAWAIASVYGVAVVDAQPLLVAALVSIVAYPVVALLMMPIDRSWSTPRVHLFERGA